MVSFILCDIARELGAVVATGMPVARILPGEGVELDGGERIQAPVVVSNADPRTPAPAGRRRRSVLASAGRTVPIEGCSVKVNMTLTELPNFTARPGTREPHHYGQINTPLTKPEWQQAYEIARAGGLPTGCGPSCTSRPCMTRQCRLPARTDERLRAVRPVQLHPGELGQAARARRTVALESIGRFCTNLPDAILHYEVLGPPDIERRVGLTGGHIFQGEILPQYLWDQALELQDPHGRRLPLRRRHASRRQRHRRQRPERGDGDLGTVSVAG